MEYKKAKKGKAYIPQAAEDYLTYTSVYSHNIYWVYWAASYIWKGKHTKAWDKLASLDDSLAKLCDCYLPRFKNKTSILINLAENTTQCPTFMKGRHRLTFQKILKKASFRTCFHKLRYDKMCFLRSN